jgi:hypothetical protein
MKLGGLPRTGILSCRSGRNEHHRERAPPGVIDYVQAPPTPGYYILEVLRKGERGRPHYNEWAAMLIDMDPDVWCSGQPVYRRPKSCWLDLGRHSTREDAWERAEQLLVTRH